MKLVKSLALVIGLMCVAYFVGATVYNIAYDSNRDGTAEFSVDTDGNTAIVGTLAVTGITTVSGMTANGTTTINDILSVSGDASNGSVQIGGAFALFPTSGYRAGAIIYYNGSETNASGTNKFYGSTATVTTASCWVPLH
jgi:hypothetical protein